MRTFEQGDEFAGHRIEGELGSGGMAVVYRARHIALDQPRALKVISPRLAPDAEWAERFRLEARLAASIDHPAVVRVYDSGESEGRLFISMQLIEGVDLARLLAAGPISTRRAVEILGQIASGLDAAHEAGLVHRDVKPENVLLAETPAGERAWLTDFGIGMLLERGPDGERLTSDRQVIGTASYISPEQIAGEPVDARSDVYSFGCLTFEVLTGTVPFSAETQLATLTAHGSAPRPSASAVDGSLPAGVDRPLAAAMAIDPARRPARASAFIAELDNALGARVTAPVEAPAASDRKPTEPLPDGAGRGASATLRQRPMLLALGLVAFAALVAGLLLGGGGDQEIQSVPAALTIDVPRDPISVAPGASYAWVASAAADRISSWDAETGSKHDVGLTLERPRAVALGPGFLWVVNGEGLTRVPLDGSPPELAEDLDLGDPVDVIVTPRRVWVLDRGRKGGEPRAVAVDPDSLQEEGEAFVGADPQALAFGAKSIWVANTGEGTVSRIDPGSARTIGSPIPVGGRPQGIASAGGQVWVVDNFGGRLTALDLAASPPAAGDRITTLPHPRDVAIGFGSVWVASGELGIVQRFESDGDHELLSETEVGDNPADLGIGGGHVWTANAGGRTISRIDP